MWSDVQTRELHALVAANVPLSRIAFKLKRSFEDVAVQAVRSGARSRPAGRERKIPRGAGYDKQAMRMHVAALWNFKGSLPQFVRSRGLRVDPFVSAFQKHFPRAWADYTREFGAPTGAVCAGCGSLFYPMRAGQECCSHTCSGRRRDDEQYFGGHRRHAIGLVAGVCQLCEGKPQRGLAAHHVFGKANDPSDEVLIALCAGCHQIVSILAGRKFVEVPGMWDALIALVRLRRHPPAVALKLAA